MAADLYLAWNLIVKKYKSQALLVLQTVLALLLLMFLLGRIEFLRWNFESANAFTTQDSYFFMPYHFKPASFDIMDTLAKEYPSLSVENGDIRSLTLWEDGQTPLSALGYNDVILQHCRLPLQEGSWFEDAPQNGEVPAISVTGAYAVGDVLSCTQNDGTPLTLRIIGRLDRHAQVLAFKTTGSANAISIEDFLTRPNCDLIVPLASARFASVALTGDDAQPDDGLLASAQILQIPQDELTPQEVAERLRPYGTCVPLTTMVENFRADMTLETTTYGVLNLIFTVLTLVGLGGNNAMQNMMNERQFVIYYMLGAPQKRVVRIEVLRSGLLLGISFLFFVLLSLFIPSLYPADTHLLTGRVYLQSVGYLILIYLLSSGLFLVRLGRANLMEAYQKEWRE